MRAMRRLMFILSVIAFGAVALMSTPRFWWLYAYETSAAPSVVIHHDGTEQPTLSGPRARWPDWARTPDGAELTVAYWQAPAGPLHPSLGFGDLAFEGEAAEIALAWAKRLERDGWTTRVELLRAQLPDLPPRPLVRCVVTAEAPAGDLRVLMAAFELEPEAGAGQIFWTDGPAPAGWLAHRSAEPCRR
jgi:hypothetical protein